MRNTKRIVLAILMLIAAGLLFRGWLYRQLVTYKSVGRRNSYSADSKLINLIDAGIAQQDNPAIEQIIKQGLTITSRQLNFTTGSNHRDPNKLITSRSAHCVGYAIFFAATCNYLFQKYKLTDTWTVKPHVGHLYFLRTNVHQYFSTPFFKDHDFAIIENKTTGQIFAVDPTINDYLLIDFITYSK